MCTTQNTIFSHVKIGVFLHELRPLATYLRYLPNCFQSSVEISIQQENNRAASHKSWVIRT